MKHKTQAVYAQVVNFFGFHKQKEADNSKHCVHLYDQPFKIMFTPNYDNGELSYLTIDVIKNNSELILTFSINSFGGSHASCEQCETDDPNPQYKYIDMLIKLWSMESDFKNPISIIELEPYPENCNPARHDLSSMISQINSDWMVLHGGTTLQVFTLVNTKTGRRFELDMYEANKKPMRKKEAQVLSCEEIPLNTLHGGQLDTIYDQDTDGGNIIWLSENFPEWMKEKHPVEYSTYIATKVNSSF